MMSDQSLYGRDQNGQSETREADGGLSLGGDAPNSGAAHQALIKDSDMNSFMADVIEASQTVPVLVDFWATWCGPCKQLTPILERAVRAAKGAVRLVKIDIDANQALASQLRISSVPTVYGFFGGRPVDAFQGVLPESQITAFIERMIQASGGTNPLKEIEALLEQANTELESDNAQAALALYQQVLTIDSEHVLAIAGALKASLELGLIDEATAALENLPESLKTSPEIISVARAIELQTKTGQHGAENLDVSKLRAEIATDPDNHQARFDLAMALYGRGETTEAAEALLESLERDRNWNEGAAKTQLLEFFEAWGLSSPQTSTYRRKLSAMLFS